MMNAVQPTSVWALPDITEWRDSFIEMIEKIHPFSDLCLKLTASRCSINQTIDSDTLNSIVSDVKGHECDFLELMVFEFRVKYKYVRAVHASKPVDIESILKKGLSVFSVDDYFLMAKSIFLNGNYPSITIERVRCAVEKTAYDGPRRLNKLHFFLTENYRQSMHYFEYGSEFMCAVACNLGVKSQYVENQKIKGFSTMFLCNIPVENISDNLLCQCLLDAISYLFNPLLEKSAPLIMKDVAISIDCRLSPLNIVSHHPFP
jgi:hypothetical protein